MAVAHQQGADEVAITQQQAAADPGAGRIAQHPVAWGRLDRAYGDDIEIESEVTEFRRSSFFVRHTVTKVGGPVGLIGYETRLWTVRDPADPKRLKWNHAGRDHRGIQTRLMGRRPTVVSISAPI